MSGYNLPPGCYESDLPGWHDIEVEATITCPNCGDIETTVLIDSRYGDYEEYCPKCDEEITGTLER